MSKYDELKRLAEAANAIVGDVDFHFTIARAGGCDGEVDAVAAFLGKANPHAILELIAENERNQRMLLAACMDMGAIGEALGADMNSDGEELLSMAVDMKAENERLKADAERYQWLRGRLPGSAYRIAGVIYSEGGEGVDAGIDAAMKESSL